MIKIIQVFFTILQYETPLVLLQPLQTASFLNIVGLCAATTNPNYNPNMCKMALHMS